MSALGIHHNICLWIKDFLTKRPQSVRMGSHHSTNMLISTGAPQGCVLSPCLYSLYTYDCIPSNDNNIIIKFADDTTVLGLITNGNEYAYREEVQRLTTWCMKNNLTLNIKKTKELIIDFRKKQPVHIPLHIHGEIVERVSSFKFLGTHISEDLSWKTNITASVKKAQQRMYFLRMLMKINLSGRLLVSFYRCSIKSILTYNMLVWYGGCLADDKKALQRVIKTAQNIIKQQLPALDDIYNSRCLQKTLNIVTNPNHPAHQFFELLPSGKRFRSGVLNSSPCDPLLCILCMSPLFNTSDSEDSHSPRSGLRGL